MQYQINTIISQIQHCNYITNNSITNSLYRNDHIQQIVKNICQISNRVHQQTMKYLSIPNQTRDK